MFALERSTLENRNRHRRWGFIGLATAPLIGAVVYSRGFHLPFHCPILATTGIPCPTCGMTRSFVAIAQGNFAQAIQFHAFGLILFASFLLIVFHLLLELVCNRSIATFYTRMFKNRRFQISGILLYFGYYLLRLYWLASTGEFYLSAIN